MTALALMMFLVAGCSGAISPPPAAPPPASEAAPAVVVPAVPAAAAEDDALIAHSQLKQVIDRGPQQFIQLVRVRPAFQRGKFFGWRLLSYAGPGPLAPGDIVRRVNEKSIEKPEQFMAVWNELESHDELVVELVRSGVPLTLRYRLGSAVPEVP